MDDIMSFSNDLDILEKLDKDVLQQLQENDLYLKLTKCKFKKTKIEYLGMVITKGKISMDSVKLKGIQDWPAPTTVKEVWSFLGFGNSYRKFINKFSELAAPLNRLLKKDKAFDWTPECQMSFDTLKQWFTAEPVLMMPDQSWPFQIEADTSKYTSGAVLTQMDSNSDRHPVAYFSKTFNDTERNYKIYDRELLGVNCALEEWQHYIQGSGHTTIVHMDHQNQTYFKSAQKLNRRQAWWALYLLKFDLKLIHIPGAEMIQSDALSWQPDYIPDQDNDNVDRILLPENMFVNLMYLDLQDRIANMDKYNYDIKNTLELLLENRPNSLRQDLEDWQLEKHGEKNVLFYKDKNYIPDDLDLWQDIVKMFHDHETAGHPGELETYNSVKQHYGWPGMCTFVKRYVQGCGICQQFKINQYLSHPSYMPIEGAKSMRPFASCSMDMITNLPTLGGYNSILAVVDHSLMKGVILIPCNKTLMADQCAQLLLDNIYKWFGLMDKIISDWGPQFAAKSFLELLKLHKIKSLLTTAYHLQSDGATERVNQEIEAYISIFCTNNPEEWSTMLSTMEFTHNNRRHTDQLSTLFWTYVRNYTSGNTFGLQTHKISINQRKNE